MHFNLLALALGLLSMHASAAPITPSNITFGGNNTLDPEEILPFKGSKSFSIFGFRDVAGSGQQRRDNETDDGGEEPSILSSPALNSTKPHHFLGGGAEASLEVIGFRR
ncbi:hypothetical protein EVG20_g1453 [Dentipellis fragilis]|uniref:Uncharacterized protein n=1 Tax=Dentipellis fragilis TaxID=205917 RepID=A0A4Y9ZAU8_9AGAM|nr:hypothetical protein EVG20_g1453 [Dentipellis fragilis]